MHVSIRIQGHLNPSWQQWLENLQVVHLEQLTRMLREGRRGDMLEYFFTKAVGMPAEFVAAMRQSPFWTAQEALAPTLVNEAILMDNGKFTLPKERLANVTVETLVIDGGTTSWLSHAADAVAHALPNAKRFTIAGQPHNVADEAMAPVLVEFFQARAERRIKNMKMKLELVPVPVADIDRAKAFYVEQVGFHADVDVRPNESVRIVQLTPPGSACSIVLTTGVPAIYMPPGSLRGLHLVVGDVASARAALIERGVAMGEIEEHDQGIKYAAFSDPDGNTWTLQEMPWRASDFRDDV